MNILEFIRKNSILVIIVIAGITLGLIMSEYSQKNAQLGGDLAVQVNDHSYSEEAVSELSSYAEHYFEELIYATPRRLRNSLDSDGDGQLTAAEEESFTEIITEAVAARQSMKLLEKAFNTWQHGYANEARVNIAANRAIIRAEGEALGIVPSKEQIDEYIKSMPVFQQADGSFDQALYRRLSGHIGNRKDNVSELRFRQFISDLIVWQVLEHIVTDGIELDARAAIAMLNISLQDIQLKTAWLPASAIPAVAEPSDADIKAFWELHKQNYLSDAQRAVSLYTLTPAEGISIEELYATSEQLMQTIAESNQADIDGLLAQAAKNPEFAPFSYLLADGKTHQSFPAYTSANIPAALGMSIEGARGSSNLGGLAFEVDAAPSLEAHAESQKQGNQPKTNIKQLRGFFPTPEGKLVLLRVDALRAPGILDYEAAKPQAKRDLIAKLQLEALNKTAEQLLEKMTQTMKDSKDVDKAFALASTAGATVENYGPVNPEIPTGLPTGMDAAAFLTVPSGGFAPLSVIPTEGARISLVLERSYNDSPGLTNARDTFLLPQLNQDYRDKLMLDWIHQAYAKYKVEFAAKYGAGQK